MSRQSRSSGKRSEPKTTFNKAGNELFGNRWPDVVNALAQATAHAAVVNQFAAAPLPDHLDGDQIAYQDGPITLVRSDAQAHRPPPDTHGPTLLKDIYWSDVAAALPVSALQVRPGHTVLDMCAAPGGKTILLAHALYLGDTASRVAALASSSELPAAQDAAAGSTSPGCTGEADANEAGALENHPEGESPSAEAAAREAADMAAQQLQDLALPQGDSSSNRVHSSEQAADKQLPSGRGRTQARPLWRDGPRPEAPEGMGGWADDPRVPSDSEEVDSLDGSDAGSAGAGQAASHAPHFQSRLVSNEMDSQRRVTLKRVVAEYLPEWVLDKHQVSHYDAGVWYRQKQHDTFDRILLDPPSTVDRLTVQNAATRQQPISTSDWSVKRCLDHSVVQVKLLIAGSCALKPGGRMVYTTGSMFSYENEGSVQRALDKATGLRVVTHTPEMAWLTDKMTALGADATPLGWCCLPDRTQHGAVYLCVLTKDAPAPQSDSD